LNVERKNESEREKEQNRKKKLRSDEKREQNKKSENQVRSSPLKNVAPLKDVPYPHALSRKSKERQFARFLNIQKRFQITMPFTETLEQMPTYSRFMKEMLTNKRKFPDQETVELEAGCSAIIQKSLL